MLDYLLFFNVLLLVVYTLDLVFSYFMASNIMIKYAETKAETMLNVFYFNLLTVIFIHACKCYVRSSGYYHSDARLSCCTRSSVFVSSNPIFSSYHLLFLLKWCACVRLNLLLKSRTTVVVSLLVLFLDVAYIPISC